MRPYHKGVRAIRFWSLCPGDHGGCQRAQRAAEGMLFSNLHYLFQTVQLMISFAGSREEIKQTRTERPICRSTPRYARRGVQGCCPETWVMLFLSLPGIRAGTFMVFLGCMDGLVALGFCFCTGTVARCFMIEIDNQWQGIKFSAEASSSRSYRRPDSNFFCPPSLAGT